MARIIKIIPHVEYGTFSFYIDLPDDASSRNISSHWLGLIHPEYSGFNKYNLKDFNYF